MTNVSVNVEVLSDPKGGATVAKAQSVIYPEGCGDVVHLGVGSSKPKSPDKYNPVVGDRFAVGRALIALGQSLVSDAQELVDDRDRARDERRAKLQRHLELGAEIYEAVLHSGPFGNSSAPSTGGPFVGSSSHVVSAKDPSSGFTNTKKDRRKAKRLRKGANA